MRDTYAQLFIRFFYAQNASPLFENPFSRHEHGEVVFPMNNELVKDPSDPNIRYIKCIYIKKNGHQYGIGQAFINMDIFYNEDRRINGKFSDPKPISEAEFIQWMKQIEEELDDVSEDRHASPNWYL